MADTYRVIHRMQEKADNLARKGRYIKISYKISNTITDSIAFFCSSKKMGVDLVDFSKDQSLLIDR